jgi:hypothetical protein
VAIPIPDEFDVNKLPLDVFETYFRDALHIDMTNWAKFRYTIRIGNHADCLYPMSETVVISENIKEAYRELAKSHYAVIRSLGWAKLSLIFTDEKVLNFVMQEKSQRDFYFYLGRLLDNLARLIYIVNDADSPTNQSMRHWIDWGTFVKKCNYPGYIRIQQSKRIKEIKNIRNALTHGWAVPQRGNILTGPIFWPIAIRYSRDFLWWYDEKDELRKRYRKWVPAKQIMYEDYAYMERFQSKVFAKLTRDVRRFEKNHGVEIRDPAG